MCKQHTQEKIYEASIKNVQSKCTLIRNSTSKENEKFGEMENVQKKRTNNKKCALQAQLTKK